MPLKISTILLAAAPSPYGFTQLLSAPSIFLALAGIFLGFLPATTLRARVKQVDCENLVATPPKLIDKVGSDEPGSTGHKDPLTIHVTQPRREYSKFSPQHSHRQRGYSTHGLSAASPRPR